MISLNFVFHRAMVETRVAKKFDFFSGKNRFFDSILFEGMPRIPNTVKFEIKAAPNYKPHRLYAAPNCQIYTI